MRTALILALVLLATAAGCTSGSGGIRTAAPTEPLATPGSSVAADPSSSATPAATPEARDALATAAGLMHTGRYEEAAAAYESIASLATDPAVGATALLQQAVARYSVGDAAGSIPLLRRAGNLAAPGSNLHRRITYLLAVRLNESGAFGEAAEVAAPEAASTVDDPLRPYLMLARAEALTGGNAAGASDAWAALAVLPGVSGPITETMYQERARLSRTAGDDAGLVRWLSLLADLNGAPGDRLELARTAKRLGDPAAYSAQLLAIVSHSPASSQAATALELLDAAGIAVDPGQRGLVLYRRGDVAKAAAVLEPATREAGIPDSVRGFRLYYLAASYEDAGRANDAVRTYDAAAAVAGAPYAHRAKYWAARVVEGTGDTRSAAARYLELALSGPSGEFSSEAAFRAGYSLLGAGDAAGAVAAWNRLAATRDARLLYWRGRASEMLGDAAGAAAAFEAAVAADPLDFYGVEAGRKLGRTTVIATSYQKRALPGVNWDAIALWLAKIVPGTAVDAPVTVAADLVAIGLREEAAAVLVAEAQGAGTWRLLALAEEADGLGLKDVVVQLAMRIQGQTGVRWADAPVDLLRAAYPLDYAGDLDAVSRANGLDPLFFAALVRQESLWDPAAGSYAGALGLTQVIPPTGESIAAALGVSRFTSADLFRPGVSLRFGAYYIGTQVGKYGPYLGLAAYNAGPGAANRWQSRLAAGATGPDQGAAKVGRRYSISM